jgi:hypothetical protein
MQISSRKLISTGALLCTLGLAAAACGSANSSASSPTTSNGAGAGATTGTTVDTVTAIPSLTGAGTTVSLDAGTLAALTSLGVKPAPFGTATLSGTNLTFPITGGYAEIHTDKSFKPGYVIGSIEHDGSGLTLTKGSTVVTLENFVVDPGNSVLYATVGGAPGFPLATLDGSDLQVSVQGATVHLDGTKVELTPQAASALNQKFGTSAVKAGLELGVAHIAATGTANQYKDTATEISRVTGEHTSVDLNAATLGALTQLGVTPGTIGSATLSGTTVTFPITGGVAVIHSDKSYQPGYIDGAILHQGSGLRFTKGSTTVDVTDFVVDPGDSLLYATVGKTYNFPLFFLDGSQVQVSQSGGAVHLDGTKVELTPEAASALNAAFGTTALKPYTLVGIAHLVVS